MLELPLTRGGSRGLVLDKIRNIAAPDLVQGEHFGLRVNWGNAGYANAFGITGAAVLSEGFAHGGRLTGTLGIAFAGSQVGGNAGLRFSW